MHRSPARRLADAQQHTFCRLGSQSCTLCGCHLTCATGHDMQNIETQHCRHLYLCMHHVAIGMQDLRRAVFPDEAEPLQSHGHGECQPACADAPAHAPEELQECPGSAAAAPVQETGLAQQKPRPRRSSRLRAAAEPQCAALHGEP